MLKKVCVVGSGFSGAVIARELALMNFKVDLFESRSHLAGNCHTYRDAETGIMVHAYGPHIFHTSNEFVWNYARQFDEFMPFVNRVKSVYNNKIYNLPINLMTINAFFGKNLNPSEAREFINSITDKSILDPKTFEEQALHFVGRDLYEAFLKGYTEKQWGIHPRNLPASILKRLPVRFNYDDNYYASKFQGIPKNGYTYIIDRMLNHANIDVKLNTSFHRDFSSEYDHIFYSGSLDAWFDYSEGRLGYRTLDFNMERYEGDYQGNAVVNYSNKEVPYTRISEHKHFAPWEEHDKTIVSKEYSRQCGSHDIPYYPIRLIEDQSHLTRYEDLANIEKNVTFVGRLGTYRYLDMHVTIEEALGVTKMYKNACISKQKMPAFCVTLRTR